MGLSPGGERQHQNSWWRLFFGREIANALKNARARGDWMTTQRTVGAVIRAAATRIEERGKTFGLVQEFLRKFDHSLVARREREAIEEVVEKGQAYLAEIVRGGRREVAGCALVYELLDGRYFEVGSVRVPGEAGLGGFEVQCVFLAAVSLRLVAQKYANVPGDYPDAVFATIAPENFSVQDPKLRMAGFSPWEDPPKELKQSKANTVVRGSVSPLFYRLDESFIPNLAKLIFDIHQSNSKPTRPSRSEPDTLEELEIEFELHITRRWLDLLDALSKVASVDLLSHEWRSAHT